MGDKVGLTDRWATRAGVAIELVRKLCHWVLPRMRAMALQLHQTWVTSLYPKLKSAFDWLKQRGASLRPFLQRGCDALRRLPPPRLIIRRLHLVWRSLVPHFYYVFRKLRPVGRYIGDLLRKVPPATAYLLHGCQCELKRLGTYSCHAYQKMSPVILQALRQLNKENLSHCASCLRSVFSPLLHRLSLQERNYLLRLEIRYGAPSVTPDLLRQRIRGYLLVFMIGLVLSGIWTLPTEASVGRSIMAAGEPSIAYRADWLMFLHVMVALVFIGPLRNPMKNVWVIEMGVVACALMVPFSLVMGAVRGLPLVWRLLDCAFGCFGFLLLWNCWKKIEELTTMPFLNR